MRLGIYISTKSLFMAVVHVVPALFLHLMYKICIRYNVKNGHDCMCFGKAKFYGSNQFLTACKEAMFRLETLSDPGVLSFVRDTGISLIPEIKEIGSIENPVWREYSVSPAHQKFGAEGVLSIIICAALAYKNTRKLGCWVTGIPIIPAEQSNKLLAEFLRKNSFDELIIRAYEK